MEQCVFRFHAKYGPIKWVCRQYLAFLPANSTTQFIPYARVFVCTCECVLPRWSYGFWIIHFISLVRRALQILNCLRFYARMCKQIYVPGLMICSATNARFQSNDVDVLRTFAYSHSADRYSSVVVVECKMCG